MTQSTRRPFTKLIACTLALGAALSLSACSSSGPRKAGDDLGLTKKQKEGLFLENAIRYVSLGDFDRAQDQARKGLEISPGNKRFLMIFGRCNLQRGGAQDILVAIDTFKRIDGDDRNDFRVQASWGAAVERLGMFYYEAARGVESGERTTKAKDPKQRAEELRADAIKHWEEAYEHFTLSLTARSGEPEAINGLVRTSALLGRPEESIEHSRELIKAIQASQRLVNSELDVTDITAKEERRLFKSRVSNTDFEVKARLHITSLLRTNGQLAEAIEELDAIAALDPYLAQAHSQKAQLLFESGDFVKARASVTRFLEMQAPTSDVNDPDIRQAFELIERCDRQIVQPRNG